MSLAISTRLVLAAALAALAAPAGAQTGDPALLQPGAPAPVISNNVNPRLPGAVIVPAVPAASGTPEPAPAAAAEPRQRLEFQDYVLQTLGRDLPLFGANLFVGVPSTFAPVDNVPVTPDYVIGPGDEIQIRAWGQIDVDYRANVGRDGTISVPKVGVLSVAGLRFQDLNGYLRTAFGRVFRNFELTANLGRLRSIQIFVVGQAQRPGTYTVSSLSTLVTALFAAGGPSPRGSMRSIQLKRGNRGVADLDLYDLLISGDKSGDARLLPGDVIYIPPVGALVALHGSVNVPAIYELKRETELSEIIRWAGGLAATAQGQKATVERIDQRRTRRVEEFSLDPQGLARDLRDGDVVTVFSLPARFDNAVTLRGNVIQPGRYPFRPGMRVQDLIPSREALISREYWLARAQIVGLDPNVSRLLRQQEAAGTRLSVTDLNERPGAPGAQRGTIGEAIRLRQLEQEAARLAAQAAVPAAGGAAQAPGFDRTRLLNQIAPSTNEVNWEYAVIERINPETLATDLLPFNLARAVIEADPQHNLALRPGDVLTVFSREDIALPQAKQTKFIRVEGEVPAPGIYQIRPGETLRQLLVRIGGATREAFLFGAEFTRESTRVQQQKALDESINRLEQDIQRQATTRAQNVMTTEDSASLKEQADAQRRLVLRLRELRSSGRIVLQMPEQPAIADLPEIVLEDGDRFYVPPRPSMVSVFGSVFSGNSFVYRPDARVADYLGYAGGATRSADESSTYVLRADGSVLSARQGGGFLRASISGARLIPGDAIIVPEEIDRTTFTKNLRDWTQIFFQFGLGAAALKVIRD